MSPPSQRLQSQVPRRPKAHLLLLLQSVDEWAHPKRRITLWKWYHINNIKTVLVRRPRIPIFKCFKGNSRTFTKTGNSRELTFTFMGLSWGNRKGWRRPETYFLFNCRSSYAASTNSHFYGQPGSNSAKLSSLKILWQSSKKSTIIGWKTSSSALFVWKSTVTTSASN